MTPHLKFNKQFEKRCALHVYQHKKTLAQGMMDLALLSANANQLRYVLESGGDHPYYYPSLIMISTSLILQVSSTFRITVIINIHSVLHFP